MTNDVTTKPDQNVSTQQGKQVDKSPKNGIGGRLKAALDDMVWNGTKWDEAAWKANLTVRSMRMSMQKAHVLRYIRAQRGVLLAQSSAQTFHRLSELRDQDENRNAAVAAARTLEAMTNEAFGGQPALSISSRGTAGCVIGLSEPRQAGLQIVIHAPPEPAPRDKKPIVDITPNAIPSDDRGGGWKTAANK